MINDKHLPTSDRDTVRCLLATDANSALTHYESALADGFHPYAGPLHLVTSLLAGQLEDALTRANAW